MKFAHLADLHLGKTVNGFSMIEDQRCILDQIVRIIREEDPDAVLIAGDIYDRTVPSAEAVELFDDFLVRLVRLREGLQVFAISGNHDSAERIAFGGRLMDASGLHVSPVYDGQLRPFTLTDEYGEVDVWMLPFIKPAHVRRFFPEEKIESWTDALGTALSQLPLDPARRNVLIAHQFVTGALRSDSEEIAIGGLDNVDASVFSGFDYVALGHIHRPQNVSSGEEAYRIRYSGSPLKYSFSECAYDKSVTIVELGPVQGDPCTIRTVPLVPLRDLKEIRGSFAELSERDFYEGSPLRGEYLHITLTDEEDVPDAQGKLRKIYPYMMALDYDNTRTRARTSPGMEAAAPELSPMEMFADFYMKLNGKEMSEEQAAFLGRKIEKIWEDEG